MSGLSGALRRVVLVLLSGVAPEGDRRDGERAVGMALLPPI
jgi:hypothetical protein